MEKAYDHMNWKFLLYLLRRCGFEEKWYSWIEHCISSARFSVLINRSPSGFFDSSRGVRQGDPLSPFLFVMVTKAFSRMINASINKGLITGFSVGASESDRVSVSHLLFADDTLVFCGVDLNQVRNIGALLVCFEAVSGLKVNLAKSALVPIGNMDNVGNLAGILGCGTTSMPLSIWVFRWGLHSRSRPFGRTCWRSSLEGWLHGNVCISRGEEGGGGGGGGVITLIKSTLSNFPTYFLSLFLILAFVEKRNEKIPT
jgi:hypothetical protein